MHTIAGFKTERLNDLNLNCIHAIVLDWLVYYAHSGKQLNLNVDPNGMPFYWVKFSKIFADIPLPFNTSYKLTKCFNELSGTGKKNYMQYPLIKKTFASKEGNKVGLAIRENVLNWLKGSEDAVMPTFREELGLIDTKNKRNEKRKTKLNQNVIHIVSALKKFYIGENKYIFTNTPPTDAWHYTKGLSLFQAQLCSLYEGHFMRDYVNNLEPWFTTKYAYYISKENNNEIKKCKGDWNAIMKLVLKAAKNYCKWFDAVNEVVDKQKLPHTMQEWFFSSHNKTSMFYICLIKGPSTLRESNAEMIYNKLPYTVISRMNKYLQDPWDGFSYWNKIYTMHKWYKLNARNLMEQDSNCIYFLETEKVFFDSYKNFMNENITTPSPNNFGIGNATWKWFLNVMKQTHDISIFL